ncbi:MAG: hypothetical protein J0L99_06730 [Chitinophagales bacterium]|nr:hypothetical protein [Chitinophagales bacterium]
MQSIEIKKGVLVKTDELIESVSRLETSDLNTLLKRIQETLSIRSDQLSIEESGLLSQIRTAIPASALRRFQQLHRKQHNQTISAKELEELRVLADFLETQSAQRVELLGRLASLKNITLSELRKQMRIQELYA